MNEQGANALTLLMAMNDTSQKSNSENPDNRDLYGRKKSIKGNDDRDLLGRKIPKRKSNQ